MPPPFPDAADEEAGPPPNLRREAPRGIAVAAFTFLMIVGVSAVALWFATTGRQSGLGTNPDVAGPAAVDTVATRVAVVAEDGTILRGKLWSGDDVGIIVAPGYSDDAADAELVASSLARSGHTVLFFHLRGQRPSGGLAAAAELPADLRSAVSDLKTRGVDSVYLVGYRQSATLRLPSSMPASKSGIPGRRSPTDEPPAPWAT